MAQVTDYTITENDLTMEGLRVELENIFAALGSANRGSDPPDNPFNGMSWIDTSASPVEIMKIYSAYGWVEFISFNTSTGAVSFAGADYILNVLLGTGDIIYAEGTTPTRLNIGAEGYVMMVNEHGKPSWQDILDHVESTFTVTGVTLEALASGFKATGGTSAKTLTVDETATLSDKANKSQTAAKVLSQAITMTEGETGGGIAVPHHADLNMGTGDFGSRWVGSIPSWSGTIYLISKHTTTEAFYFRVSAGTIEIYLRHGSSNFAYSVAVTPAPVNQITDIIVSVDRGNTATFYINGEPHGDPIDISAAGITSINNTQPIWVSGAETLRSASTTLHASMLNFAPTAAEAKQTYDTGIPAEWKGASQTPVYESDFSAGVDGWTNEYNITLTGNVDAISDGTTSKDDTLRTVVNTTDGFHALRQDFLEVGKRYEITYTYYIPASNSDLNGFLISSSNRHLIDRRSTSASPAVIGTWTTETIQTSTLTISPRGRIYLASGHDVYWQDVGGDDVIYIADFSIKQIGTTLLLEPEGMQPTPGQWLDNSGNKHHARYPAEGASLTRLKNDFEYRYTNTWTASSATQQIGGVSTDAISTRHYISEVITTVREATSVQNIIIGDQTDTDRYVTTVSPGSLNVPTPQTVVNRIPDGTNMRLTITPASTATMSVETAIRGIII